MTSDDGRPGDGDSGTDAEGAGAPRDGASGADDLAAWLEEHFPTPTPTSAPAPTPAPAPEADAAEAAAVHSGPEGTPVAPTDSPAAVEAVWPAVPSAPPAPPATPALPVPPAPDVPPAASRPTPAAAPPPSTPPTSSVPPPPGLPPAPPPAPPPATPPSDAQQTDAQQTDAQQTDAQPPTVAMPSAGDLPGAPDPAAPTTPFTRPDAGQDAGQDGDGPSALDDLFGEEQFRDYGELPTGSAAATVALTQASPAWVDPLDEGNVAPPRAPEIGISRTQKIMLWVAGSLVGVLALVALFLVGTRIPDLLGTAPVAVASASPSPSPTPTEIPIGPVAAGDYHWDELLGSECLDPYTGPWADDFTVVECSTAHAAQLVTRGSFDLGDDEFAPYPGIEALQSQINLLCTAPTVIDYAAAGKFDDVQFEASFAATPQEWSEGQKDYFCFVSRSSGDPLTGTVAIPPVAPVPSPSPSA